MEQSNVEMITKLVMEALEHKQTCGFAVPIGVSARHVSRKPTWKRCSAKDTRSLRKKSLWAVSSPQTKRLP